MTDTNNDGTQTQTNEDQNTVSNADVKGSSLFKQLASELAESRKERDELKAKTEDIARQAEIDAAKRRDDFEAASKLELDAQIKKLNEQKSRADAAEARALKMELKSALVTKGAKATEGFISVAMAEYSTGEFESVDSFVEQLSGNDDYKGFFGGGKLHFEKPQLTASPDGSQSVSVEKINQMRNSNDPKLQAEAAQYLDNYYRANGKFPEGLSKRR